MIFARTMVDGRRRPLLLVLGLLIAAPAQAMTLSEALDAAVQNDPAVRQSLQETDREGNALLFADGMTLHQVRAFLEVHGFLHVTPRYNVERVNAHNFYDLVVVETPGSGGG